MAFAAAAGKHIVCKAMVMMEKGADLVECNVSVAPPKAGEVRIKVFACGICHTDYSEPRQYPSEKTPAGSSTPGFPVILGHEGAGLVESVGDGVTSVKPGDSVIALYQADCGRCSCCTRGKVNLCTATEAYQGLGVLSDGTSRFTLLDKDGKDTGKQALHFMGCSTFCAYTVVMECSVAKINSAAPLDKAGLLGCGVTTGYGSVLNTAKVEPNSTAAVFGLGGVGLAVVMGLKHVGCRRIIGVDLNAEKEAAARAMGMDIFIDASKVEGDVEDAVWNANGGGLDYTFECTGNTQVLRSAIHCASFEGSTIVAIGVAAAGKQLEVRPFHFVCGKKLVGTAFGGVHGRSVQFSGMVDDWLAGRPPFVDAFVSRTVPHTDVNDCFARMHGKTDVPLRSVITFAHPGDAEVAAHRLQHTPGAIIFMHGLGDTASSWKDTVEYLAGKINKRAIKAVSLQAPVLPITKNNGERENAWFDVLKPWPAKPGMADDEVGIAHSVKAVHAAIDRLVADGIPSERIIVGGFSQGAVMALAAVFRYGKKLGGAIALSGWAPLVKGAFEVNAANAGTSVFWGHGADDEIVSVECQKAGVELLAARGIPVQAKTVTRLGHDTNEEEFDGVLDFIKSRFGTK